MAISELSTNHFIDATVRKLADRWPVTCSDSEYLVNFYRFPENLEGLKILDIGAGMSDLTAHLLEKGADAYAFDYHYNDKTLLDIKGKTSFTAHFLDEDMTSEDIEYQKAIKIFENMPFIQKFWKSFNNDNDRYIAGSMHSLPFAENSIDLILSHYGILGVAQENMDLLKMSFNEAIRVLKPGGQMQLGPMDITSASPNGVVNQELFITDNLMTRQDLFVGLLRFDSSGFDKKRLIIKKYKK